MDARAVTDTLPTRMSLLDRLKNLDDDRSWEEFVKNYRARVTGVARQRGLAEWEADEVAQEVFKRVARTIGKYESRREPGSFRSWLFQLTRWRAGDRLRDRVRFPSWDKAQPNPPDDGRATRTSTIERIPAPSESDVSVERESRQHLLSTLLQRIKTEVSPKQIQIFQLLVVDEFSPEDVAKIYAMSTSAVYVIKHRVKEKLRAEISRLERPPE